MRVLLLQDRHVTHFEIETNIGFHNTSIHSIFYEHLAIKRFGNRSKNCSCRLTERDSKETTVAVLRNTSINLWQAIKR